MFGRFVVDGSFADEGSGETPAHTDEEKGEDVIEGGGMWFCGRRGRIFQSYIHTDLRVLQ